MRRLSRIALGAVGLILLMQVAGAGAASPSSEGPRKAVRPGPIGVAPAGPPTSGTVGPGTTNKSTVRWSRALFTSTVVNQYQQVLSVSVTKAKSGPLVVTASAEALDEDSVPFMTVTANNVELSPVGGVGLSYDISSGSFTWAINRGAGTYVIRLLVYEGESIGQGVGDEVPDLEVAFRSLHVSYV